MYVFILVLLCFCEYIIIYEEEKHNLRFVEKENRQTTAADLRNLILFGFFVKSDNQQYAYPDADEKGNTVP